MSDSEGSSPPLRVILAEYLATAAPKEHTCLVCGVKYVGLRSVCCNHLCQAQYQAWYEARKYPRTAPTP
jgi:hypothetical protein